MKVFGKFLTLVVLISFLAGCGAPVPAITEPPKPADTAAPKATEVPPTAIPEPTLTIQEAWLKANQLGQYDTGAQDWAAIEAAAKKEGKLLVYSNSSRVAQAAEAFAAMYPEITVEPYDMGGAEVIVKVREEQKAGAFTGDVWFSAGGPDIEGEFIPNQYIWKFIPADLLSVIPQEGQTPVVTASTEVFGWVYNTELNDTCPITNWWELTNPEWRGKILIKDPVTSAEDLGMLMSVARHADELAAAYKALYGADVVLDADTPDAGWLWIKRFAQNEPVGLAGSDDVWEAMATPGVTKNMLGWLPLSKYRNVLSGKAVFEPCIGLGPVMGVQKRNYLAVINQAPHPNAAKLFIKFALSTEGFAPWNQVGQFSARTDVAPVEAAIPYANLPVWDFENLFVYNNIVEYRDFYAVNLLTKP